MMFLRRKSRRICLPALTASAVCAWILCLYSIHEHARHKRQPDDAHIQTETVDRNTETQELAGRNSIENACYNKSKNDIQSRLNHQIEKKSIFYCPVTKVASTFTRGLLARIPKCKERGLCLERTDKRQKPLSKKAFSFMWTRDPYIRIFSAYENKLFHPNDFWEKLGKPIILRTRKNPKPKSVKIGHDVTFAELVQDILDMTANRSELNIHLKPIHALCDPCEIPFDFIGKLETFSTDVSHVCNQLKKMNFLVGMESQKTCDDDDNEWSVYSRLEKLFSVLKQFSKDFSAKERLDIMLRTWRTSQLRGFVSKHIDMPFSEKDVHKIKITMYKDALQESIKASMNVTELIAQRQEALIQAYMTVPMADKLRLKEFVRRDCQLFGYDEEPEDIFHPMYKPNFDYFGGLL